MERLGGSPLPALEEQDGDLAQVEIDEMPGGRRGQDLEHYNRDQDLTCLSLFLPENNIYIHAKLLFSLVQVKA